jgi:hypothetical protein
MDTEHITRAEIQAMIDVQSKSVEQLTIIAKSLQDISAKEEKIQTRLFNGLGKEITEAICKSMKECEDVRSRSIEEMREIAKGVKSDTTFLKWLYTGLFGLVALAWLIVEVVKHVTGK